jgi:hypothetical protein
MKYLPRPIRRALPLLALWLGACGGGGGSDTGGGGSGGGGGTPPSACTGRVCITSNLSAVTTLAVTTSAGRATAASGAPDPTRMRSTTPTTINVLGYDAQGNPVPNPLVANVNLYIAGVTTSPDGQDVYLLIDDNQNQTLYADYRAMRDRCVLYRVRKASGGVECLMDADRHALSNPGRNPVEYGNRAEPYVKFDAQGNGYVMAYRGGGSINHRLYKLPRDGAPVIVRDFVDEYYGQNIAYARDGTLFYSEVDELKPGYRARAFLHDMGTGAFSRIADLENRYIERIATSIDGQVFVVVDGRLHAVDQDRLALTPIDLAPGAGGEIIELTRNPAGGVFVLLASGDVHVIEGTTTRLLAQVGAPALLPHRDAGTDLFFQRLVAGDEYLLVRGAVEPLGASTPDSAVCLVEIRSGRQRCEALGLPDIAWYSFAFIGPRLHAFYATGGRFMQATAHAERFLAREETLTLADSEAGNGSIIASVSLRPAVSFVADLATVRVSADASTTSVMVPVEDRYSVLSFTAPADITGITADRLALRDAQGQLVDAFFRVDTRVIYAALRDTTGTKPSGRQLLGAVNDHQLVYPEGLTAPAFTRGIFTRSGRFPVPFTATTLWLDMSAPVNHLDLAQVQVTDLQGQPVGAMVTMTHEAMRLEIRFRHEDPDHPLGLRALAPGSSLRVRLPERVRLPGQTFLSPFDRTDLVVTVPA